MSNGLYAFSLPGFPKLVSLKAKVTKTLFGPIKLTNPPVQMAYKGQRSFGIIAILYTYRACKPYSGLLNSPIHQSEWCMKAKVVSESLLYSLKNFFLHTQWLQFKHKSWLQCPQYETWYNHLDLAKIIPNLLYLKLPICVNSMLI